MEERINGLINRMNREKFERFLILKQELINIATPSVIPEAYGHLIEAFGEAEESLKVSLKIE